MSGAEIGHRIMLVARHWRWRRKANWSAPAPSLVAADNWSLVVRPHDIEDDLSHLLEDAHEILSGSHSILGCEFHTLNCDWHFDPQFGIRAPENFSPDIDYRDSSVAGNVKNIWELSRHQHLTLLAVAYAVTREDRFADEVARQIDSWISDNPPLRGVNWHSALELGIRLISWVWIERLLRGSAAHKKLFAADGRVWSSVYWHQWILRRSLSRGSSSNNHLVGELAGLFVAATVWPYFDESDIWAKKARESLEREAARQNFRSGLNREQAFSYHLFALELFTVAGLEAERAGSPFSSAFRDNIRRMFEAIPCLMDFGGNLPRFGDSDDGLAVQLASLRTSRLDFLFHVGRRWLAANVPDVPAKSGSIAADLAWGKNEKVGNSLYEQPRTSVAFRDAGVFVLSTNRNTPKELFLVADAGPLGFLSIAAHGHSDALSFALSIGGKPIIVDPGTFSYFLDPRGREYFRSTFAHNTITIDGQSQSVSGGAFLWTQKAKTAVLDWAVGPNGAQLVAEHYGYKRLKGRPIHRRRIELRDDQILVEDLLSGRGGHALQWRLHFHPACQVTLQEGACRVVQEDAQLYMSLDPGLEWGLVSGGDDAGWYSSGFNLREPAVTLIGKAYASLPRQFVTKLTASNFTADE